MLKYIYTQIKGKTMNNILLISNDELLSQLYVTNLEVYVDGKIYHVETFEESLEVLKRDQNFKLIISLANLEDSKIIQQLKTLLIEKNVVIPIIIIGEQDSEDPNVIAVKNYYSVQNIIRTSAKILGVTAKSMATKVMLNFYPLDIGLFQRIKNAPVDLYVESDQKEGTDFELFAKKDEIVKNLIFNFKETGGTRIYVKPSDRLIVINHISTNICEALTMNQIVDQSEKSELLSASMDFLLQGMFSEEVNTEILSLVSSCSKVMTEVVKESPNLNSLLTIFQKNKNGYGYIHSMLSAYVASHIVKNVPWGGESHIEKINFVLFFHDIPLAPIFEKNPTITSEEDLLFLDSVTDQEKDIILNHARICAEMVSGLKKCPIGADLLIRQHHGMSNGIGFAMEYRDDISPLSKIIIISEAFVEEVLKLKKEKQEKITVPEIIELLKVKFDKHTYRKIIETINTLRL
jgi:HD-GYP domain-containing protein (c-di-GMP phosphodiesterase class II)